MTYSRHLELHFHWLFLAISDFEEFTLGEIEQTRDDIAREHIDLVVERQHIAIIEAAGGLDLVFRVGEFALQLKEILVGLEIRVGLRDCEQAFQRIREHVFGLRLVRSGTRLHSSSTGRGHFFKHAGFVRSIAFDRIDEIRNQIIAALELHVDIAPGFADAVAESDETVEEHDDVEDDEDGHHNEDKRRIHRVFEYWLVGYISPL